MCSFNRLSIYSFALLFSLTACGGGGGGGGGDDAEGTVDPVVLAAVQALFPDDPFFLERSRWNAYVRGGSYSEAVAANGTQCNPAVDTACIHAGELRVVQTNKTSCAGLTASDNLGAFEWTCDASDGTARLISTGLAVDKGLTDLIDFDAQAFKSNRVSVFENGKLWGQTPESAWWSNVIEDASAATTLDGLYKIQLVLADPQLGYGYVFIVDNAVLVVKPGVTMTNSGPGFGSDSLVFVDSNFAWFEGSIDATDAVYGVRFSNAKYSVLRNVSVSNSDTSGVVLSNSANNTLAGVTASNNGDNGVFLTNAANNTLAGVTASNNVNNGVALNNAANNTLSGVTASNNAFSGVTFVGSNNNTLASATASNNVYYGFVISSDAANNTLSGVTASNNGATGVSLYIAANNTLSGVTASNSGSYGVELYDASNNRLSGVTASNNNLTGVSALNSSNNTLSGVTASNNGGGGVQLDTAPNNTLSGVTASNNTGDGVLIFNAANNNTLSGVTTSNNNGTGVNLNSASNNKFTGLLQVGENLSGDCSVFGGTNPGLIDVTCGNDVAAGSDATLTNGITLANSFVGKVAIDDTNTSHNNGAAGFPTVPSGFDWGGFDNLYRGWGMDGFPFPSVDNQGRWIVGTGRIWDWSLSAADSVVRDVLGLPTGDSTLTHTWNIGLAVPTNDDDCNAIVPDSINNGGDCETTFLRNSVEIPGDDIGNDNGLCESAETCVYAPNIGSYQGHGNLVGTGAFVNGTLTGITLMRFDNNGR